MKPQITRNNHYVPQWYQRGFLAAGQSKLHVLDLSPERRTLPNGREVSVPAVGTSAPQGIFCELDLYTTRFGEVLNDEIERFLFGDIDNTGATAVRAFANGDQRAMHESFQAFFEYLDAQKLRTPKGLDWISSRYAGVTQLDLMREMQGLRQMHCTMWSECVREIVSADKSPVKFLISDHPITIYHSECPSHAPECGYPQDPGIDLIGSQTVFALDANHCLILTNLEYAKEPATARLMAARTHARYRGQSLARTDAMIRGREFGAAEVTAVNHLLKSRARRYVAAGNPDWLFPERSLAHNWQEIGKLLLPVDGLWGFGGEIYVGYKDGSTHYQDEFGRTSSLYKHLRKDPPSSEPQPQNACPCGSGLEYQQCCQEIPVHGRPSWTTYSIRERNLMLCNAVVRVLELDEGNTWHDVRRELSEAQVKRIHDLYAGLWPVDTQLPDMLPRPQSTRLRAVFMGALDSRTLPANVTALLEYFDEIVLAHPFIHPATVKPEYSPSASPAGFKEQTLRNVYALMSLEPHIAAGRVHLLPDMADFDAAYRNEMWAMAEQRLVDLEFSAEDKRILDHLAHDDHMRWLKRLPDDALRSYLKRTVQEVDDASLQGIIETWKQELEDDPLALLQPVVPGKEGAQARVTKGFNLENGMFVASLTGAILYADLQVMWSQLHTCDGDQRIEPAPEWQSVVKRLEDVVFPLPMDEKSAQAARVSIDKRRDCLRALMRSVRSEGTVDEAVKIEAQIQEISNTQVRQGEGDPDGGKLAAQFVSSIPVGGFRRKDVTRLLLTFGRAKNVKPPPLAIMVRWKRPV
jgi:hypothetical protein